MIFFVEVHDACSDDDDYFTFESVESAALALGVEWSRRDNVYRAEIPRGDYNAAFSDPKGLYTPADIARENDYEAVYATGKYAEHGKKIDFHN
jgi:hypothetical protein